MMESSAFSPCQITGVLVIRDDAPDPLLRGSLGAGVCLQAGVLTKVRAIPSERSRFRIVINGNRTLGACVSERVLDTFLGLGDRCYEIEVEHVTSVPLGAGFGTSGAGALSLSLALNEALGLGLTRLQAAQIAHRAEIECGTGLGSVLAEMYGGFALRGKAGAPGVGEASRLPLDGGYHVISISLGPLSTKEMLRDASLRERLNPLGEKLLARLQERPSPEDFMRLSRRFTDSLGLMSERVKRIACEIDRRGFPCSMALFGETLFSLVKEEEAPELEGLYRSLCPKEASLVSSDIDFWGARPL